MTSQKVIDKYDSTIYSGLSSLISKELQKHNNIDDLVETILLEKFHIEKIESIYKGDLYEHFKIRKKLAQLSLNKYNNQHFANGCEYHDLSFPGYKIIIDDATKEEYKNQYHGIKNCDKNTAVDLISKYFILYNILCNNEKEHSDPKSAYFPKKNLSEDNKYNDQNNNQSSSYCDDLIEMDNGNVDSSHDILCIYCDNEIVNGACNVCGATETEMSVQPVFSKNKTYNIDNHDKIFNENSENFTTIGYYNNIPNISNISREKIVPEIFNENETFNDSKEYASQKSETDTDVNYNNDHTGSIESILSWTCVYCGFNTIDQNVQNCGVWLKSRENLSYTDKPNLPENVIIDKAEILLENEAKWKCTSCTFLNEKSDKLCKICLEICKNSDGEDIDVLIDLDLPEETWLCKECRSNNSFEYYKCQNCRSIAPFFNKWKCEKCSFFNEKLDEKCDICETENINLIKCCQCNKIKINKQYDRICVQCTKKNENSQQNSQNKQDKFKSEKIDKDKDYKTEPHKQFKSVPQINIHKINNTKKISNKESITTGQSKDDPQASLSKNKYVRGYRFISEQTDVANSKSVSDKEISKDDAVSKKSNNINQQGKIKNSKNCKKCKINLKVTETHWCAKCEMNRWFCENEACNAINFKNKYSSDQFCDKCKAKMGSDFSNCKNFEIFDKGQTTQMWQCEYCMQFNAGRANKCAHCSNRRVGSDYKKCVCKWVNLSVADRCQKCDQIPN